jgi:hypothetical protein
MAGSGDEGLHCLCVAGRDTRAWAAELWPAHWWPCTAGGQPVQVKVRTIAGRPLVANAAA